MVTQEILQIRSKRYSENTNKVIAKPNGEMFAPAASYKDALEDYR